ncbi:hypothetical protein [Methylosinus sp. PW1]|uniref:hypothetical protein n=1 Tax=Methylosinus sp. PW1 TaxID=107636 RepID=UPI000AA5C29C|nr:hypothetical protein [Methylosinus sp. PW1]
MHATIADALAEEDAQGGSSLGVREYPDWRRQAEDYEAELSARGEEFAPIEWNRS